jgi:hypothetical protein
MMTKFVLLHYGFETPTQEIMDAWNNWFASIEDKTIENVGLHPGTEVTHAGTAELAFDREALTGYTVIEVESMDEAIRIAKDCPFITSVRVHEVRSM